MGYAISLDGKPPCLATASTLLERPQNIYCLPAEGGEEDACGFVGGNDVCVGQYSSLSNYLNELHRLSGSCEKRGESIRCRIVCKITSCSVEPYEED